MKQFESSKSHQVANTISKHSEKLHPKTKMSLYTTTQLNVTQPKNITKHSVISVPSLNPGHLWTHIILFLIHIGGGRGPAEARSIHGILAE